MFQLERNYFPEKDKFDWIINLQESIYNLQDQRVNQIRVRTNQISKINSKISGEFLATYMYSANPPFYHHVNQLMNAVEVGTITCP